MKSQSDSFASLPFPVREGASLREYNTLRLGGAARFLIEPRNPQEAAEALEFCHIRKIPVRFLGGGSNVLISDEGFEGAVILTDRMKAILRDGEKLKLFAGVSLPGLVHDMAEAGLSGIEGLVGIPGSVGGAVRMNSGGRWGEMWDRIEEIEIIERDGRRYNLPRREAAPSYRDGGLDGALCASATIRLERGEKKTIREKTAGYLAEKAAAQPLTERSAGCIFRNPEGKSAGKLIQDSGCKGWNEGGAVVSEKHGNFFLNRGGASAEEFRILITRVMGTVQSKTGVELHPEIEIW